MVSNETGWSYRTVLVVVPVVVLVVALLVLSVQNPYKSLPKFPRSNIISSVTLTKR